jgi:hypothetical protein
MIETVREVQTLVDELLRAGRPGRDFERMGTEPLQARRHRAARAWLLRALDPLVVLVMGLLLLLPLLPEGPEVRQES